MLTQRDRVDSELAGPLAAIPPKAYKFSDIAKVREGIRLMTQAVQARTPDDASVAVEESEAAASGSTVPVRLFRPVDKQGSLPAVLWFHAGGMVAGFAAQEDAYLKSLAKAAGCVVVSVEYRLAPEYRPPAAVEDGFAAYSWLLREAMTLKVDTRRVGIAGASGGGAIAAALALMIRDRRSSQPLFQALSYPMLDDRMETPSSHEITAIGLVDREGFIALWEAVLGDQKGKPTVSPYAAPARAETLDGVAPAFIGVGELDVVRDESMIYASRLVAAGVATELHLYPGAYHAFDVLAPNSSLARTFTADWHSFIRRRFASVTQG